MLLLTSKADQDILDAAAYIETQLKLFMAYTTDASVFTAVTTDIASQLVALKYDRTVIFASKIDDYKPGAWASKCLSRDPGSITWNTKNLIGVEVDEVTDNEYEILKSKNVNFYIEIAGLGVTTDGRVASSRTGDEGSLWIDNIRGGDWTNARVSEKVFQSLVNQNKVPYTQAGVDAIRGDILSVLRIGVDRNVFTGNPEPKVDPINVLAIPEADRAARVLKNIKAYAQFSGAIHKVEAEITLSI